MTILPNLPQDCIVTMRQKATTELLSRLRSAMKNTNLVQEKLQAYIIPSEDAHQSEYLAACDERRAFISGFTGSRGLAVVTECLAALWTDGRYFQQAAKQLDSNWTLMKEGLKDTPSVTQWLIKVLPDGGRVGIDPKLISASDYRRYSEQFEGGGLVLMSVPDNLVDSVWAAERPQVPHHPIVHLPLQFSGRSWKEKVHEVREKMQKHSVELLVISALDEIAWLFNLRGSDIAYNPVFFAYAFVSLEYVYMFVDADRLTDEARQTLDGVVFHPYSAVTKDLALCVKQIEKGKIWVPSGCSQALVNLVPKAQRFDTMSPICMMKAVKHPSEMAGMTEAHLKDGVAHCEFLHWLEHQISNGVEITEISAADKFEEFRRDQRHFVGLSFPTISGSGPNASVIHYKPVEETNRLLSRTELYLVDSGAQYRDGTTDVTRTISFGEPTDYEQECFTRVLKGHISLASLIFPEDTSGYRLDSFSRVALWEVGLEFMHGTGHGVGHYLNVHEGPSGFGMRRKENSEEGIAENMCLTIEPGYYEDDKFGIRLENVYKLVAAPTRWERPGKKFLTFEPLTLVPIQQKMLKPALLTAKEVQWLNDYHAFVQERIGAALERQGKFDVLQWLNAQTRPLG